MKLGFVSAILPDQSLEQVLDFAAQEPRLAVDMLSLIRRQDELMPLARAAVAER